MLILFVLCTFLRTLQGASVPSPPDALGSAAVTNMSSLMGREPSPALDGEGQQFRTAYSIAQSCLATIFACVWKSAHPNINGPRDSGWTCMKRRLIIMFWTVIAPEVVLWWALRQYVGAKEIAKQYNKEFFPDSRETERTLWAKTVGWFRPLPKITTRRGDKQPWTVTHGFFIQMGGFMLYDDDYPTEVLDYDHLAKLLRDNAIDAPIVTERDLQDRSKSDPISKAILLLQATWFVMQCIARAPQRLPLSELEVITLAFAVINGAIYAAWWSKPQGVDMTICIPLKKGKPEANSSTVPSTSKDSGQPQSDSGYQDSDDNTRLIPPPDCERHPNEHIEETHPWFWRQVHKDYQTCSLPCFLIINLPYHFFSSVLQPIGKMTRLGKHKQKNLQRMPMFYSVTTGDEDQGHMGDGGNLGFWASFIVGPTFGSIHFISWASEFPSPLDRVLWRISAILMTAEPLLLILAGLIHELFMEAIGVGVAMLCFLLIPFYIAARFACIIIALKAIVHPPPEVLLDVAWTSYIPHL